MRRVCFTVFLSIVLSPFYGVLRGVPLLRPHPAAVWMGIAPSQSDARYTCGRATGILLTVWLIHPGTPAEHPQRIVFYSDFLLKYAWVPLLEPGVPIFGLNGPYRLSDLFRFHIPLGIGSNAEKVGHF